MRLSDLNPGDVFRYLDGRPEFLSGLFMKMHQKNTYISPMTKKRCNFIISLNDGIPHNHADRREVEIILKYKERTMENKMNHFIGWKFGVPVKIQNRYNPNSKIESMLIWENDNGFRAITEAGPTNYYAKDTFTYELIPHKAGVVSGPRYPVCQSTFNAAYCNADESGMSKLGTHYEQLEPVSIATLNIDGKTIELSAETTAELKKKLGV